MADSDIASAPKTELRVAGASPGLPATAAPAGFPAPAIQGGPPMTGPAAAKAAPKRSGVRRLVLLLLILAAVGYGGKWGYDYFVEGRFLVSTDDAYVGASTAILAAKATGHLVAVPSQTNGEQLGAPA